MRLPLRFAVFPVLAILLSSASAATRTWTSSDGQRKIQAELVKHDNANVTLRLTNGQLVTMEVSKLAEADRKWLAANDPAAAAAPKPSLTKAPVFDTLAFGDTHDKVLAKLKASKLVKLQMDERLLGRTGLNDVFRTEAAVAGLHSTLYFGWDAAGNLEEVSLHSEGVPAADFTTKILPCCAENIAQLTNIYGPPLQAADPSSPADMKDGSLLFTHLWHLDSGGSILVGTANDAGQFRTIVRVTRQVIQPIVVPKP
jgi:hypothetical protein